MHTQLNLQECAHCLHQISLLIHLCVCNNSETDESIFIKFYTGEFCENQAIRKGTLNEDLRNFCMWNDWVCYPHVTFATTVTLVLTVSFKLVIKILHNLSRPECDCNVNGKMIKKHKHYKEGPNK
jgi:hypothetical protein